MSSKTATVVALLLAVCVLGVLTGSVAGADASGNAAATNVSVQEIQQNATGTASPYAGQTVTTTGTVTAINGGGFYVQNGSGAYAGVFVAGSADVTVGDTVRVTAPVEENFGLTRLTPDTGGSVTVTGNATVPDAVALSTGSVGQEAYEGVRVRVTGLTVAATPGQYGEWDVDDGSGVAHVDDVDTGNGTTPDTVNSSIDSITGPVFYSYEEFKIQPAAVENLAAPPQQSPETNVSGPTLTVLSYNDIQTAASNPAAMGRLVGTVNERRAAHDNPTVVIGGGDQVSPSSLSPVSNWTVPVGSLNRLDPAAEVVGNHDLDYGFDAVPNYTAASEFPWLLANVVTDDGETVPGTKNYSIVERDGVRIGVVGLVDEAIKPKTAVDFERAGYQVADFSSVGSRIATDLKTNHNVDVVVATAHIGVPESKQLAQNTENIDVIVTGDDEVEYEPQVTDGTVITEAASNAEFVGELNLTVGQDATAMESGRLITVGENAPVNESVRQYVNESRGRFLSTVAGRTEVVLNSTFTNYNEETRWGNLITDAFLAQTGAEVALTNAGGIRGDFTFGPGNVTYDDVYTSLPFGNTLVTKQLTGAELRQFLASQVTTLESDDGQRFGEQAALQVAGVTYEYVPHEDAASVVRDVHVRGAPIEPNGSYNVTVNSYMAGFDTFQDDPTVSKDLTLYGTAAVDYIEANTPVAPDVDGHIQRVDATGEATTFATDENTTVDVEVPETFTGLNGSVWLTAPGAARVAPESVSFDGERTVTATFDRAAIGSLTENTSARTLELYAEYDSSRYDLVFHDHARLNADVPVAAVDGRPTVETGAAPVRDTDGDGQFEDIDGDGSTGLFDALTYYTSRNSEAVQSNPTAFDFDGDGRVGTLFDALALYDELNG